MVEIGDKVILKETCDGRLIATMSNSSVKVGDKVLLNETCDGNLYAMKSGVINVGDKVELDSNCPNMNLNTGKNVGDNAVAHKGGDTICDLMIDLHVHFSDVNECHKIADALTIDSSWTIGDVKNILITFEEKWASKWIYAIGNCGSYRAGIYSLLCQGVSETVIRSVSDCRILANTSWTGYPTVMDYELGRIQKDDMTSIVLQHIRKTTSHTPPKFFSDVYIVLK